MFIKIFPCLSEQGLFYAAFFSCLAELVVLANLQNISDGIIGPNIIEGNQAHVAQFPYVANIIIKNNNKGLRRCGGSILDEWNVLTAAHCFAGYESPSAEVLIGLIDLDDQSIQRRLSSHIFMHPDFQNDYSKLMPNDLAIIRVADKIEFSTIISPVVLSERNDWINEGLQMAGFGVTDVNATIYPKILQFGDYQVVKNSSICKPKPKSKFDSVKQFCVKSSVASPCIGDNGSGMVKSRRKNGFYELMGVMSESGHDQQCKGLIFIFTFISPYYDWIQKTKIEQLPACSNLVVVNFLLIYFCQLLLRIKI